MNTLAVIDSKAHLKCPFILQLFGAWVLVIDHLHLEASKAKEAAMRQVRTPGQLFYAQRLMVGDIAAPRGIVEILDGSFLSSSVYVWIAELAHCWDIVLRP